MDISGAILSQVQPELPDDMHKMSIYQIIFSFEQKSHSQNRTVQTTKCKFIQKLQSTSIFPPFSVNNFFFANFLNTIFSLNNCPGKNTENLVNICKIWKKNHNIFFE